MKIGLYSPFASGTMGGGERYLLTIAACLLPEHEVDLILPSVPAGLKEKFVKSFNLNLAKLNLLAGPFGPGRSTWERWQFTKKYDVFYYMTDGSFFLSHSRRNIVHFMIPFNRPAGLIQRLKLLTWPIKTTHSRFCREALERIWRIKINYVQWGAVETTQFKPLAKQNLIINVGRWFTPKHNQHCKRQDFLAAAFKKLCDQGLKDWRLALIGPVEPGRENLDYFKQVKKLSKGYPIDLLPATDFKSLVKLYGQAKIYWHATGYGTDAATNPQASEHFGISTIEAMASGAVPVVINQGGQPEIVNQGIDGLLWQTQSELMNQTLSLVNNEPLRLKLAQGAQNRAKNFSLNQFCQTTKKIFNV